MLLSIEVGDHGRVAEPGQPPREAELELRAAHDRGEDEDGGAGGEGGRFMDQRCFEQCLAVAHFGQAMLYGHAASSSRSAWARASSVTWAPDSILAISSRRRASSRRWTLVRVTRPAWLFSIRRGVRPRAAACGEWVTTSNWAPSASRWRRSPIALATAPPTPR